MKKLFLKLSIIFLSFTVQSQVVGEPSLSFTLSPLTIRARHYNFGFENVAVQKTSNNGLWFSHDWNFANLGSNLILQPVGWSQWGYDNYALKLDSVEKRSGRYSTMIEKAREGHENSFGCVVYAIPAEYAGRNIEVRAWFKGESAENTTLLMLRIDGGRNEILSADNRNQLKRFPAPQEWTEYSVSFGLPEDAETIYIGATFSGKGKLWVDDFRLFIDGKDIRELQQADLKYKALNDDEFDEGSYITFGTLTPQMVENLALLAKVWGFLKYYHPAVGSGDYHWDYVLFRAMGSMLHAQNPAQRNFILNRLVDGLGDFRTVRRLNFPNSRNVSILPDLDWIDDRATLGEDLSKKLNEVKLARRDNSHYYIRLHRAYQTPVFRHENDYLHISPNDDGYRMLGLFKFWNMVQYFYPYRYKLQGNWHNTLTEFIPIVAQADSSNFRQVFTNLALRTGDPQTYIPSEHISITKNAPPLAIDFVENKPIITDVYKVEQPVDLALGDEIKKVNQRPVEEIIAQIRREEAARSVLSDKIYHTISGRLLHTENDFIQIEYQRDGQTFTANLRCYPQDILQKYRLEAPGHELLTEEIGYLRPQFIKSNALINTAMQDLSNTKGIIIDLRPPIAITGYGNIMNWWYYFIVPYLTSSPVDFVKKTIANIQIPGLFTYETQKAGIRNRSHYSGKIVVLVDRNTNFNGQLAAIVLRALPNSVIAGSAIAIDSPNYYALAYFSLPCNFWGGIFGNGLYYPDGSDISDVGIVPDVEVKPTIRGIIDGRDEVLERAMQIIKNE